MVQRLLFRLLILLLLTGPAAFCKFSFDSWTVESGLPRNTIRGIVRANDGYIWMITPAGMVRFDGLNFELFDRSNIPGLTTNNFVIFSLTKDSHGGIWAGTWDGGAVCYRNGSFRVYSTRDGLPNNAVVRIDEDAQGTVWIYSLPGLTTFKDGKLTRIAPLPGSPFNNYLIHPGNFSVEGYLWGLWRYSQSGWERFAFGKWSPFPVPEGTRNPHEVRFNAIAEDSEHRLWYQIIKRPGEYFVVENGRLRTLHGSFGKKEVICEQDRQGRLWTSNDQGEAAVWENGVRHGLTTFSTVSGFSAIDDPEIGLWIATLDKGLFHLREQTIANQLIPGDLQRNVIQNLVQEPAGTIWIGSIGVTRWKDGKFRTFYRKYTVPEGYWKDTVNSIFLDRDNTLWIGYSDGVARFENNRIVEATGQLAQIRDEVHVMHRDRFGNLWFGSNDRAYRLQGNNLTYFTPKDGLAAGGIRVMDEDAAGGMWFGTDHGLSCYRDGKFITYTVADGLSSQHISALHFDRDGTLWIGTTDAGLNRLKNGLFTQFSVRNGLPNLGFFAIADDGLGNFWLSSQVGLHRVRKTDLDQVAGTSSRTYVTTFGKADGLGDWNCTGGGQPRHLRANDGTLLFPTLSGLAILNPAAIPRHTVPLLVYLGESLVDGKRIPANSPVVIPPGNHNLEVHYAAVAFAKPEQIQFRYRLSGLDSRWTEVGNQRVAYFTHLPPGRYSFELQATNADGSTNATRPTLAVTARPWFYQTSWFWALCISAAIGIAYVSWQRRVEQLEKAHAAQQNFSRLLIESQEAERKRIASELHDSLVQRLAVIKNLALLSMNSAGSNNEPGQHIIAISAEAGQAMSEVREISHNLRPYQLDILGLTKAIEGMIHKVSITATLALTSKLNNIDGVFEKESEINVFRIVQECLTNILRHSEATEASVLVERSDAIVVIAIRDNGKGFSTDGPRGGLGLSNIAERARLLGGRAQILSEPGKGTEVRITVEISQRRPRQKMEGLAPRRFEKKPAL